METRVDEKASAAVQRSMAVLLDYFTQDLNPRHTYCSTRRASQNQLKDFVKSHRKVGRHVECCYFGQL